MLRLLRTPAVSSLLTAAAAALILMGLDRAGLFDRELIGSLSEVTHISREVNLPEPTFGGLLESILGREEGN